MAEAHSGRYLLHLLLAEAVHLSSVKLHELLRRALAVSQGQVPAAGAVPRTASLLLTDTIGNVLALSQAYLPASQAGAEWLLTTVAIQLSSSASAAGCTVSCLAPVSLAGIAIYRRLLLATLLADTKAMVGLAVFALNARSRGSGSTRRAGAVATEVVFNIADQRICAQQLAVSWMCCQYRCNKA